MALQAVLSHKTGRQEERTDMVTQVKQAVGNQAERATCPSFVESVGGALQFKLGTGWFHDLDRKPGSLTLHYLLHNLQ